MEKIKTELRVTALTIHPFTYKDGNGEMVGGESFQMRAAGFWVDENDNHYPASLHMVVYPGHGIIPAIGDCVSISVERNA